MIGLGTIINTVSIIAAGVIGSFVGRFFKEDQQKSITQATSVCIIFIAIAGAMEGMLSIGNAKLVSGQSMLIVLSLAIGTVIGELIGIEKAFDDFGEWLKRKSGNTDDKSFVNAFVIASLTVSIGAMAVVGSIEDGISGDYTTLVIKSILDFILITVMSSTLGKGAAFSAIPVFVFEGLMTLGARALSPVMTDIAIANLSLVGSILIFCVGINLLFDKGLRVANMLPALVVAVIAAYL